MLDIGMKAPDFILSDKAGNMISLSDFIGNNFPPLSPSSYIEANTLVLPDLSNELSV